MHFSACLLLFFCVIYANGQQDNGDVSPTPPLYCNCSNPDSQVCTLEGVCNAAEVKTKFQRGLKIAKNIMSRLGDFPGDVIRRRLRDELCQKLSELENITEIFLLDFEEWEPACVRIGDHLRYTCSLAPKDITNGKATLTRNELNRKFWAMHDYLQCPDTHPPPVADADWHFCRDGDFCNQKHPDMATSSTEESEDETKRVESDPALRAIEATEDEIKQMESDSALDENKIDPQGPMTSRKPSIPETESNLDSDSEEPNKLPLREIGQNSEEQQTVATADMTLVYILVPIAILILIGLVVLGVICYKFSIWTYVYRVTDHKQQKNTGRNTPSSDRAIITHA